MQTITQRAVPINARQLAVAGDARALLAIPDARVDIPRLISGKPFNRQWSYGLRPATELGSRKAIAAAKALIIDRNSRRQAKAIADAARLGTPERVATKLAEKRAGADRKRQEAGAKRKATIFQKTKEAFLPHYRAASFRTAAQESTLAICVGDGDIESDTEEGWIDYKRHGWRRGIKSHKITVAIPLRWDQRVNARGLGAVDGLLTLDADPIKGEHEGIELYRATWAQQGRGLAIGCYTGVIARHTESGTTFHAVALGSHHKFDSASQRNIFDPASIPAIAKAAGAGLRRKMTAQGVDPAVRDARRAASAVARAARRVEQLGRLVDRVKRHDLGEIEHVVVTRRDSLRAGNCEPGTDEFIGRFFPDRSLDSEATIGEIGARVLRLDSSSLTEGNITIARQLAAACLIAIRRDKQGRRTLASV